MPPRWHIVSLLSPLLAYPLAYLFASNAHDSGWGWGGIGAIIIAIFGSTTFGLIAGVVAIIRRERWPVLTMIALLLNLFPVLVLLFLIITK